MRTQICAALAALAFATIFQTQVSAAAQYDVVVIGGTPSGIAAAVAAGRAGKTVLLVEQAPVLGGVLSSGIVRMDDNVKEANSGVIEEFRQRIEKYHLTKLADDPVIKQHVAEPQRLLWDASEGRAWEPKTAARVYAEIVAEVPKITTRFNEVPIAATVKSDRVVAVTTRARDNNGRLGAQHRYAGRVIIDATYEGDVAAFAGVPFRIGREARSKDEPHAGHIYTEAFCAGKTKTALLSTIFPGSTGRGDDRMMAFSYRFVLKDYGKADHPYRLKSPPPDYDASRYRWDWQDWKPWLPNRKADMLGITFAGDLAGLSTRYVLADWEERSRLEQIYRNHELGWLYYIQTEGGSPQWGLADDEFTDNDNWPYRLYVREGRRIEGLYTLTESDIHKDLRGNGLRGPLHPDSVAIGIYPIDSHNTQNPFDLNQPCGEGTLHLNDITGPYQIPYGVMVPRNRKGLLVPVAISSTHAAMSSVRVEPTWSSLGQAAGVAAVLALDSGRELSEVPVTKIQNALLQQSSALFFYMDLPGDAPEFEAVQKLSLLGAVDGDENYYFRPNQPITMGDFARLVVRALDIPLSVTAAHFTDVPREHPAFKYVETLYDYSTQSTEPFFPFEVRNYLNYWWASATWFSPSPHGPPVFAYPDHAITGALATKIISGLLQKPVPDLKEPDRILTRGEAVRLIHRLRGEAGSRSESVAIRSDEEASHG